LRGFRGWFRQSGALRLANLPPARSFLGIWTLQWPLAAAGVVGGVRKDLGQGERPIDKKSTLP
jgi:hypothetical protein